MMLQARKRTKQLLPRQRMYILMSLVSLFHRTCHPSRVSPLSLYAVSFYTENKIHDVVVDDLLCARKKITPTSIEPPVKIISLLDTWTVVRSDRSVCFLLRSSFIRPTEFEFQCITLEFYADMNRSERKVQHRQRF